MSPAMQTLVVAAIVAVAVAWIGRRVWATAAKARRDRNAGGCSDGCCK